ncbi:MULTISPECIES: hypothetical protein [unclassified Methanoregula]|uniref:hypothetical protein n=1 Tax=unclassified Methanoregula TaxID=2649730 RepID=UPI0009CE5AD0|nr:MULTISPECIES: hypothetical protein [unclassified Methanoregula]OPX64392.1 MAG: hypothetical protein A4E33_00973 [Methanoregula sp. PtaB.Bin085]OPY34938.1 MAG: hypothetical protein A4E34_01174 [Methanoregula sp. PtaU1.Bin006]
MVTLSVAVPVTVTDAAPSSPVFVTDAPPYMTPDPYPAQHAMRISTPAEPSRNLRYPDFRRTFALRGNSTGLVVNATSLNNGPLWISFDIEPLHDCLEDAESCRGNTEKTIGRPYFTLTVRDNGTRALVAEDGYGGIYSSQKTNRTMKIYEEGWYHLTLEGNWADVTLSLSTGALQNTTPMKTAVTGISRRATLSPEILRHLREDT